MGNLNADLTSEAPDAEQLTTELRAANARIEQLVQMHRHYIELFTKIAQAAGVQLNGSLEGVVDTVIAQLSIGALTAPLTAEPTPMLAPTPEVPDGPVCVICGAPGAVDLGDGTLLCDNCSGANALAEGLPHD